MEILGIDIGFGFTKATNGNQQVIFKSIYGEAADIQFWADFGHRSPTDYCHVTMDGRSYFVGDLAEQQSRVRHFTLDQEKLITEFVKILALSVAGIFFKKFAPINVPINVVSGLPIGFFKRNHQRFGEILSGHHEVTYHTSHGESINKEIYINKVRMLPQPLGSYLNMIMNGNGKIIDKALAEKKVGIVDIGFRTTDFAIMDHLRYIDRGSRTMDTGVSKAFNVIADKLTEQCGVHVELFRLYDAVEEGSIHLRGKEIDFTNIKDRVFAQLAQNIANDLERLWIDEWDIDTILLTGGGCRELAPYLQPMIPGNVKTVDIENDARLTNVHGYLKYGKYVWGDGEPATKGNHASKVPNPEISPKTEIK